MAKISHHQYCHSTWSKHEFNKDPFPTPLRVHHDHILLHWAFTYVSFPLALAESMENNLGSDDEGLLLASDAEEELGGEGKEQRKLPFLSCPNVSWPVFP